MNNLIKSIAAAWVSLGNQLWGSDYHIVGLLGRTPGISSCRMEGKRGG